MKTTVELIRLIEKSRETSEFVDTEDVTNITLAQYLNDKLIEKNMNKPDIIAAAQLPRGYCYKVFNGEKKPSKYKLICFAFAFGLSVSETQRLLAVGGCGALYPRIRRDSIILFALSKKARVQECNELLYDLGEELIG